MILGASNCIATLQKQSRIREGDNRHSAFVTHVLLSDKGRHNARTTKNERSYSFVVYGKVIDITAGHHLAPVVSYGTFVGASLVP